MSPLYTPPDGASQGPFRLKSEQLAWSENFVGLRKPLKNKGFRRPLQFRAEIFEYACKIIMILIEIRSAQAELVYRQAEQKKSRQEDIT